VKKATFSGAAGSHKDTGSDLIGFGEINGGPSRKRTPGWSWTGSNTRSTTVGRARKESPPTPSADLAATKRHEGPLSADEPRQSRPKATSCQLFLV
jgi:hypothetical protein